MICDVFTPALITSANLVCWCGDVTVAQCWQPCDFIVEGEQHYWVHVAIDRFTGRVIDKQIEVVNE